MGKSNPNRKGTSTKSTNTIKGRIVEVITAKLHDWPNVKVERNVFMPSTGKSRRKREIDVLLTGQVAGYPIRFAIECKNERSPIGSMKIDQFVGKLLDVGIPPQQGIFVSANGYKRTGIERAKEAGMTALTLRGLTDEGLSAVLIEAFQAIIFLLADIVRITIIDDDKSDKPQFMPVFVDSAGEPCGSVSDLIWLCWINGRIPALIGEHSVELTAPQGWHPIREGRSLHITKMTADLRISGLVITLLGKAERFSLLNASTGALEKVSVNAEFHPTSTQFPVTAFHTEEELISFLDRPETVRITQRIRLPKINIGTIFWPPSERVSVAMIDRFHAFQTGQTNTMPTFDDLKDIEGTDLWSAFEPIWQNHPLIRNWKGQSK
jgi:hypothetical protein